MQQVKMLFSCMFFLCIQACQNNSSQKLNLSEDKFLKSAGIPLQNFEIDASQTQIIVAEKGTRLIFQKGCFINLKGEIIKEKVNIQIFEAITMDKMVQANLTTTSQGKLLETGGMFYLEAKANGERLQINPKNPVYVEIPTKNKKSGMQLYQGIREENGNINWINPKPLEDYLMTVDIFALNFYPPDFEQTVDKNMPFRKHTIADKILKDSLYYSLSVWEEPSYLPAPNLDQLSIYGVPEEYELSSTSQGDDAILIKMEQARRQKKCCIDPISIKAIKNNRFQNTLLATREFEARLQWIFRTCEQDVLEIYVKNLDKNLWELDEMAYQYLQKNKHDLAKQFKQFAEQKLGKVKNGGEYAIALRAFYEKEMKNIENELEKIKANANEEIAKQNEIVAQKTKEYNQLLVRQETHRMQAYGFIMTEVGWVNIDVPFGQIEKKWQYGTLNVKLTNEQKFDRVHFYIIYESIEALYGLQSNDSKTFTVNNGQTEMPNKQQANVIGIAYQKEKVFFVIQSFITLKDTELNVSLLESTNEKIEKELKKYKNYKEENNILTDLNFKKFFAEAQKRQDIIWEDFSMMRKLKSVICNCVGCEKEEIALGKMLFKANCIACHDICGGAERIGPPLGKITMRRTKEWFGAFTRNSQAMIASGDKEAIAVYEKYNKAMMTSFSFSDTEMDALYNFLDCQKDVTYREIVVMKDGKKVGEMPCYENE